MASPVIERFISEFKLSKRPYITTDVSAIRAEMPCAFALDELPAFMMFVVVVFGTENFMRLQPLVSDTLKHGKPRADTINAIGFMTFRQGDNCVMTATF